VGRDPRELGGAWTRYQRHAFHDPSPDLGRWVERYWIVSWHYARPYRQKIVPFPSVQLTFRDGGAQLHGVVSGYHVKVLEGGGGIFGVAFRPGCFRPFLNAPVSTITDRTVDAAVVFDACLPELEIPTVEEYLGRHLPDPDPRSEEATDLVATIAAKPELTRVDSVAREAGMSVRQLQRLFAEHVGLGPKWVIRRYRLREVTDRLATGAPIDWSALAADLGYADQAHFTRDFTAMFGESPTWYAKRY
jgi:AraC-like DNA-binding protein